ncbi:MAG: DUF1294 domain-containing protein [Flavobacterium sp.]|jgi:uncharacterized membrane protein YsdA (DUF1294 family)
MEIILYLIIVLNFITTLVFGIDKWLALNNKQRISEKYLLLLTFIGGSLGAILAMFLFRHKTAKPSFIWKFMTIIMLQLGVIYLILKFLFKTTA